ncbi:MAG: HAD family hydrolase [Alphaproteobacteria bacterium]|nr:HAD family hydrolase [Alphaproteobacteria bacterium]
MTAGTGIGAVLFDKDGTLFDFHEVWLPAYRAAASEVATAVGEPELTEKLLAAGGFDSSSGRFAPRSCFVSGTAADICEIWKALLGSRSPPKMCAGLAKTLEAWSARRVAPVVDLERLFKSLVQRGLRLGVATMDSQAALEATLSRERWSRHLSFACGSDAGHGLKPEAGMVRVFANAVGRATSEVAVIGDSLADLGMARAAGAGLAIGVAGGATQAALLASQADVVLDSIAGLESYLFGTVC